MDVLLVLNPMYPKRDHNSNIIMKLVPFWSSGSQIKVISEGKRNSKEHFPKFVDKTPIKFINVNKIEKAIINILKHFKNEGDLTYLLIHFKMKFHVLLSSRNKQVILSTYMKLDPPYITSKINRKCVKALYLMDPTDAMVYENKTVTDESSVFLDMLKNYDVIFTTPFINDAMTKKGYAPYIKRVSEISFPMITGFDNTMSKDDDGKIKLLFCGVMYSDIRSPEYLLKIISRLDERFVISFIGIHCEHMIKSFNIKTDAQIITHPPIDYEKIKQVIADSDILINIGNSVPVHIPSKTLEYINTGKPFVNFYKFDECPTLHYTRSYPLCLNINEQDTDLESATRRFIDFCTSTKGKKLDKEWILKNYKDCTPNVIAKHIEDTCLNIYDQKYNSHK